MLWAGGAVFICVQEEQEERPGKGSEHPLNLLLPQQTACWSKPSGFCAVGLVTLSALSLR